MTVSQNVSKNKIAPELNARDSGIRTLVWEVTAMFGDYESVYKCALHHQLVSFTRTNIVSNRLNVCRKHVSTK